MTLKYVVLPGLLDRETVGRLLVSDEHLPDVSVQLIKSYWRNPWGVFATPLAYLLKTYRVGDSHPAHADVGPSPDRPVRLSLSVALNDGYTGGELVVAGEVVRLGVGDGVMFPEGTIHEVKEVKIGIRRVLVQWCI